MSTLTRFVLKHKLLVVAAWVVLAVAGAMTAAGTTKRLTTSFVMPGAAVRPDARIQALYQLSGTVNLAERPRDT
jgi:RND superfamily putative drug exporter